MDKLLPELMSKVLHEVSYDGFRDGSEDNGNDLHQMTHRMETLRLVNSKFRDAADEFFYRSIGHWNGVAFGEWARRCRVVAFSEHAKYVQSITLHLDGGNPDTPRMMTEQHASQVKKIFAKLPALREVRFSSGAFHAFQGPVISELARGLAIEYLEDAQALPLLHTLELTFVPKFKTTVPRTPGFTRKLSSLTALTLAWDEANANDEEATTSNMKAILEAARNAQSLICRTSGIDTISMYNFRFKQSTQNRSGPSVSSASTWTGHNG